MVNFSATILKFGQMGEKTGWTYIRVQEKIAQKLMPGNKRSFRVKGKLDELKIEGVALIPMGEGDFIIALNANLRKGIKKRVGEKITVNITVDDKPYLLNTDFMECLSDEPEGIKFFQSLPKSHQNYFSKWIESAKTETTRTKRIAHAVSGLSQKMNYAEMLRYFRDKKL